MGLFVIVFMLTALMLSLTACGGTSKIDSKATNEETIDFITRVVASNETFKLRFIAASRGYDITADDFNDDDIELIEVTDSEGNTVKVPETKPIDMEVVKKVLTDAANQSKFKSPADAETVTSFANDELTEDSISKIVKKLGTDYDLEPNHGLSILLVWIGKALKWLTGILGQQYIIAIMVFAVFVEILMLPWSYKQQKNSVGMAKLRPKIAKIEKKYAGRTDQATLRKKQEEIMALQQQEGYSALSGCGPLIAQLIIVGFILYPIIQNPLRYMLDTSADFSNALVTYATSMRALGGLGLELGSKGNVIELLTMLNITDMEGLKTFPLIANGEACLELFRGLSIPNFSLGALNLGKIPSLKVWDINSILLLVPVLNVVVQFLSMKLTRKWSGTPTPAGAGDQAAASMKMMDYMMPLMTLFIMFQVPALIGIYWLFRSGLSLLKQFIMKTILPIPKYSEEDLREIEKAEKERQKTEKAIIKTQPKYKSLHYIDADDYEDLPEMKQTEKKDQKTISQDRPEIKD